MSVDITRSALHLRKRLVSCTDYVWIGDDFLTHTFHDFVRRGEHRRYASSVPGPLEARNRAGKRRLVNVAPLSGSIEIDPSVIPGWGLPAKPRNSINQVHDGMLGRSPSSLI